MLGGKMIQPYKNAKFIKTMLDRYVIGQSSATQSIAMAVAQHFLACEYNESCDEEDQIQTDNILIIGPQWLREIRNDTSVKKHKRKI